jgi:hypothetical protein
LVARAISGEPPFNYAANGYDAAQLLFRVLQAASDPDPPSRDELLWANIPPDRIVSFDYNGDARKPVLIKIKQFTGGNSGWWSAARLYCRSSLI